MKKYKISDVNLALSESNAIECVYSVAALNDAKKAWDYAITNCDKINADYVLEIHRLLGTRLNQRIAGRFRSCAVMIGGEYKPAESPLELKVKVDSWCRESNKIIASSQFKKLSDEKKSNILQDLHLDIENIHPHEDINGRTYRLIWNVYRWKSGLPIKIIHEGDEQQEYYDLFRRRRIEKFLSENI